jgi:hypothetical protein
MAALSIADRFDRIKLERLADGLIVAVAIQLGLLGAAVLWAMWIAHLLLFRGGGLVEWIGFVVVVQNVVGSAFNSHLFDFLQGWVYVVGVGVAGGVALKNRAAEKRSGS